MLQALMDLTFFSAKFLVSIVMLLLLLAGILALLSRKSMKHQGTLQTASLNERYQDYEDTLLAGLLSKKAFRALQKEQKKSRKAFDNPPKPVVFVLHFQGDIRASAVTSLREEISAILAVATPEDEVLLSLESTGGMVHAYGLAAAQLTRLRDRNIPLTVVVDKAAASGGYMMACLANQLIAAPFAIIGSIGVILQLPNFNRLLREQNIDFEQITAGRYKRTLSLFGPNTEEGRKKSREEVEAIHQQFESLVKTHRPNIVAEQVTTGECWTGKEALDLGLVDALGTSDDWLMAHAKTKRLLEIRYHPPKSFMEKLSAVKNRLLASLLQQESLPW